MKELTDTSGTKKKPESLIRVLFVGPSGESSSALVESLSEQEFQVKDVPRFSQAFGVLNNFIPDVIILDSSGDELSAFEFCTTAKSIGPLKKSVIIILSDRKDELMEMAAFNSGADDFITHPVKINALVRRIRVRLKKPDQTITVMQYQEDSLPLKIDRESYSVSLGNHFVQLSRKEFELLYLLASNPDRLFRREELFQAVWNKKKIGKNRTLDVHISRLRQKLGNKYITSQKGIGYRLKPA